MFRGKLPTCCCEGKEYVVREGSRECIHTPRHTNRSFVKLISSCS